VGDDALEVETFLMSCRALGRGVEHRAMAHLAEVAGARGLRRVDVRYRLSAKNRPALEFLESIGEGYREALEDGARYRIPIDVAAGLRVRATAVVEEDGANGAAPTPGASPSAARARLTLRRIATELREPTRILAAIESRRSRTLPTGGAPATPALSKRSSPRYGRGRSA
jgi:hypothetical protein